jgi:NAD(P)-dependent dehydrogenase (short-subunit alcohol dehydrogenase family)
MNLFEDIDFSVAEKEHPQSKMRNNDPNAVFVVTGASRGIGLQFVKTLLETTNGKVVACCRSPNAANGLQEYLATVDSAQKDRVELVPLDLEQQESIDRAADEIKNNFDRVDLLLNVAGILGDGKSVPGPERTVTKIDRDWMEKTFQVNVIGPVMLSKALIPLMSQTRQRRQRADDEDASYRPTAVIANLSARVGSISDNGLGGWYSYRMSKAALNQATRTLANEMKRQSVWCIALHPGTTDTDLSKPFQKNVQEGRLFPVEFAVQSLLKVINSMEAENSGGLYDWAGKSIPF